jgi:biopolymer transport protein ExbD
VKRIARRREAQTEIPTASTADIAFLLIIFFMVSTVFSTEQGLKVTLPKAESTERILKRRNVTSVWVDKAGRLTVNDNMVTPYIITSVMAEKVIENPDVVVSLQADQDVNYGYITDVLEALKEARALKVTFATQQKTGEGG